VILGTAAHPYAPAISKVWNEFPLRVDGTVRAFLRLACPKRTILEPMWSQSDFFVRAPSNDVKKHFIPRFEIRSRHSIRQRVTFHHIQRILRIQRNLLLALASHCPSHYNRDES
jgi:hypothetical protein